MVAHKEIVIQMSGEELRKGPLSDELIGAIHRVLVAHGYVDHRHEWGASHKLVYRKPVSENV